MVYIEYNILKNASLFQSTFYLSLKIFQRLWKSKAILITEVLITQEQNFTKKQLNTKLSAVEAYQRLYLLEATELEE